MSTLLLDRPVVAGRVIRNGRASALIVIGLFVARWLAGIVEHGWAPGISEYAALMAIGWLIVLFLVHLQISQDATLLLAGLVAMLFAAQLSFAANPMPEPAKAQTLMALLCFYLLAAHACFLHLATPVSLPALRWFFLAFVGAGALLALAQMQAGFGFVDPARAHLVRAVGSDVHPVSFAIQLVIAGTGLVVVHLRSHRRVGPLAWLVLGLGALALYLTFARTAWAMGGMIVLYAALVRGRVWHRVAGVAALLAGVALATTSERFADLGSLPFFFQSFDIHNIVFDHRYVDNSVSWRIVNWGYGLTQALEFPWLGIGPGQSASASSFGREMHNIFLEIFLEGGIVGLMAFCLALGGLVRLHRRLPRRSKGAKTARDLVNGLGFALLAAAVFSTSLIEQLMSVLLYFLVLAAASVPEKESS